MEKTTQIRNALAEEKERQLGQVTKLLRVNKDMLQVMSDILAGLANVTNTAQESINEHIEILSQWNE